LRHLGLDNVVLQSHGVDCNAFHPGLHDPKWREEIGCAPTRHRAALHGSLRTEKNLDRLACCSDLAWASVCITPRWVTARAPRTVHACGCCPMNQTLQNWRARWQALMSSCTLATKKHLDSRRRGACLWYARDCTCLCRLTD
jgi:hypothetical protein